MTGHSNRKNAAYVGSTQDAHDQVGSVRLIFSTNRWEWSDEVYFIHGYLSGQIPGDTVIDPPLSTEWVCAHVHPDDRQRVVAKIAYSRDNPGRLICRYRVLANAGRERNLILLAETIDDSAGAVIGFAGYIADCTISETNTQQRITAEVERIARSRETIDQAKGMLMAVYGLTSDAAFRALKGWSQTSNTKLHTLAEQLVITFTELGAGRKLPPRDDYQNAISAIRDRHQPSKLIG